MYEEVLDSWDDETEERLRTRILLDEKLYERVEWTYVEKSWLEQRKAGENSDEKSVYAGIDETLADSPLGAFLQHVNPPQDQTEEFLSSKLEMLEYSVKIREQQTSFTFCDDVLALIKQALRVSPRLISTDVILNLMPVMRFIGRGITHLDGSLSKYNNLSVLVLSANYISSFCGRYLPRNVLMIELYGNMIEDLGEVIYGIPKTLIYLGLGRNFLGPLPTLTGLKNISFLNLEDNDLENLSKTLDELRPLRKLRSLNLQGNPCSMITSYKRMVQTNLPLLEVLDGKQITPIQQGFKLKYFDCSATIQINCFKLIHHRKLGKKKLKELAPVNYYLEACLPLLDGRFRESVLSNIEEKSASICSKEKEISLTTFTSDGMPWDKVIQFAEPTIEIEVSEEDLVYLRDTFRNVLHLRIVTKPKFLQKVEMEHASKTQQKTPGRTSNDPGFFSNQNSLKLNRPEVLAEIRVPLETYSWTQPYLGFVWSSLKPCSAIPYPDAKEGTVLPKKFFRNLQQGETEDSDSQDITCYLGIGLKREEFMSAENSTQPSSNLKRFSDVEKKLSDIEEARKLSWISDTTVIRM